MSGFKMQNPFTRKYPIVKVQEKLSVAEKEMIKNWSGED